LLGVRARSRRELTRALEERGFAPLASRSAVERLVAEGLLDELAAARSVVRGRGARYGRARIERELLSRGFPRDVITAALFGEGSESVPEEEALRVALEKIWRGHAGLLPEIRRRRTRAALLRRGFPAAKVSEMMRAYAFQGSPGEVP
jgi:regulatory protein